MVPRAPRGTGPGLAAMSSMTRNALVSIAGTMPSGPMRSRAGISTCGAIAMAIATSGQV